LNGAAILVESLKSQGVKHIFGIPGNHILGLYDALGSSSITHILATHEPSVGFMADTYGRVTREPGVAIVTAGPGALNLVNPTAQAYAESSPMVIIAAQCDMRKWGKGCYHELEHPEVQYNIFREITKWQTRITKADDICDKISEAFYQAKIGRHRPVYVEIPENIFSEEGTFTKYEKKSINTYMEVEDSTIKEIVNALLTADLPTIYAGGGVIASGASKELTELSEILDIPVATTMMGKGSIPEDHPSSLGYGTGKIGTLTASEIMDNADVMLAIGCRFDEVGTGFFTLTLPETLIHIDIDKEEIGKNHKATLAVVGDAKTILKQIISEVLQRGIRKDRGIKEKIMELRRQEQMKYKKEINLSLGIHPLKIIYEIDNITDDSIIIADAGNSALWAWEYPVSSQLLITPAGYNSMGFAVPSAISAKLADSSKTVIGICGDGSFLMTGMELITAVRYNIDINIIVLHDKRYNILNFFQDLNYGGRYVDTTLHTFDFAKFANDVGGFGIRISDAGKIRNNLEEGFSYKGPTLFDVYINTDEQPPVLKRLKSLIENTKPTKS